MEAPSAGLRAVDFGALVDLDDPVGLVEAHAGQFDVGFFGLGPDREELAGALERLALTHGRLFIVTLGAHGSVAFGGDQRLWCPATAVDEVVDTTGAGDAFAAGFLNTYAESRNVALSLRQGADAAAEAVVRVGAFDAELTPWA
jgi:sugar/nucleoside kinase (ribokinase family)